MKNQHFSGVWIGSDCLVKMRAFALRCNSGTQRVQKGYWSTKLGTPVYFGGFPLPHSKHLQQTKNARRMYFQCYQVDNSVVCLVLRAKNDKNPTRFAPNCFKEVSTLKQRLGRRIASLRRQAGLTQEKLAEQTGYSVSFIGLIERGINAPTIDGLECIAQILGSEASESFPPKRLRKNPQKTKRQS